MAFFGMELLKKATKTSKITKSCQFELMNSCSLLAYEFIIQSNLDKDATMYSGIYTDIITKGSSMKL